MPSFYYNLSFQLSLSEDAGGRGTMLLDDQTPD